MSRAKRVIKELEDTKNDSKSNITLSLIDESDISKLTGAFLGPPDTPYAGGKFVVDIEIPQEYPFKPPKMKFTTRVYHPNISSQTGAICLDILKDRWTPILTLKACLISLQLLLQTPVPDDPQDAVVANVYKTDKAKFDQVAKNWTKMYAMLNLEEPADPYEGIEPEAVKMFVVMGFDQKKVIKVLKKLKVEKMEDVSSNELEDTVIQRLCE
ncbi:E2 ubiquitin-conjugating protein [Saccharomycopsis crataegensis]|uniref:Ubiquitin-conjugating enzyme E2 1 n=1 Tax=Saccharomycopsis crataegensis TaxID=43959 RepID=A0AAV5QH36_9ASCO|nr:E2 ubiquitin-conjugating protein [Saccharomycopsis crataegensis]